MPLIIDDNTTFFDVLFHYVPIDDRVNFGKNFAMLYGLSDSWEVDRAFKATKYNDLDIEHPDNQALRQFLPPNRFSHQTGTECLRLTLTIKELTKP